VLGDHGEAFGQHEGNYGHTFFLYDENVHVPFLIAAPGIVREPVRSSQVVSLIDTAPTVLDLVGLLAPAAYQGQSMLDAEPHMALFFADYSLRLLGLRDGPLKFIHEVDSGRSKLFEIDKDPQEKTDRLDRYAEQARWYERNLRAWSGSQTEVLKRAKQPRYIVTSLPLLHVGPGLCVAVDPKDPQGVWWWDTGRSGCSTRSSSVMHPEGAMVVVPNNGGPIDVRFRVGLIAKPPAPNFWDVHIAIQGGRAMVAGSNAQVTVDRRNDLELASDP
jgi:hypothetical protein